MQDRIGRACTSFLKNALLDFHTLTLLWELLCVLQLFPDSTLLKGLWTEAQEKGSSLPPANIVSAGVSNMEPFNNKPSFPHWRTLSGLFFCFWQQCKLAVKPESECTPPTNIFLVQPGPEELAPLQGEISFSKTCSLHADRIPHRYKRNE